MMLLSLALMGAQSSVTDVERNYERWERSLRARVAELHALPGGADKNEVGDVAVSFSIGKDGRPTNPVIQKSSGNPTYDKAARRVVRLLGPIGAVPSMGGQEHRVQLKLSYGIAPTPAADRQLENELDAERRAYSRRNLEIVTTAAETMTASR